MNCEHNNPLPLRTIMRAMLNSKTVDRDSTYSYTDRQVLNLFQFSMCLGVFIGGVTVSAVMRLLGY